MHLDPPHVTGYVLDGIASSSGAPADKFEYFSVWETDFGEIGESYLGFCSTDTDCSAHFAQKSLSETLGDLLTKFDNEPNSTCAALVSEGTSTWGTSKPSFKLREALGISLSHPKKSKLIAPVVYRLNRCEPKDVDSLKQFFKMLTEDRNYKSQSDIYYTSQLLFYLIMFSEMWEIPSPSVAEMEARFANVKLSDGSIYPLTPLYCAFSKEKSPACDALNLGNYDASPIFYERDRYWNKSATIPKEASVLLLSSKMDVKTPHKYAEYLLDVLEEDNKELITFNYTAHGSVTWTFLVEDDFSSPTCGMELLVSYVTNDGDLSRLDKSCLSEMPPLSMVPSTDYQYIYLSTDDAYDGEYNASLQSW